MATASIRSAMASTFATEWDAQYPLIETSFENRKFAQPKGVAWADFNLVQLSRERMNIGSTRFVRTMMLAVIEIYVPEDSGTVALYEMADYIGVALEDRNIPIGNSQNVTTGTSSQRHDGKLEGFYRQTVIVPFHSDEAFTG